MHPPSHYKLQIRLHNLQHTQVEEEGLHLNTKQTLIENEKLIIAHNNHNTNTQSLPPHPNVLDTWG